MVFNQVLRAAVEFVKPRQASIDLQIPEQRGVGFAKRHRPDRGVPAVEVGRADHPRLRQERSGWRVERRTSGTRGRLTRSTWRPRYCELRAHHRPCVGGGLAGQLWGNLRRRSRFSPSMRRAGGQRILIWKENSVLLCSCQSALHRHRANWTRAGGGEPNVNRDPQSSTITPDTAKKSKSYVTMTQFGSVRAMAAICMSICWMGLPARFNSAKMRPYSSAASAV